MVNSSKKMKASLLNLAYLLDIRVKTGRLKALAKELNVTKSTVYGWIRNGQISKNGWEEINKLNISLEEWYIDIESYHTEKSSKIPSIVNAPKIWTGPPPMPVDLSNYKTMDFLIKVKPGYDKIVEEIQQTLETGQYAVVRVGIENLEIIKEFLKILESGESDTITAIKLNVKQFAEKIKEKAQRLKDREEIRQIKNDREKDRQLNKELKAQVDQLSQQVKILKNGIDSSPDPADDAEAENE